MNNEALLLALVVVMAAAVLLQAIVLVAIFFALRKTANSLREEVETLREAAVPVLTQTREFLTNVGPRIDAMTADLAALTRGLRDQSTEMQATVMEILERIRHQSSRIDHMFEGLLDTVERAGGAVTEAVAVPVRQVSAVASAIRAVLSVLVSRRPVEPKQVHSPADKDMFV